MSDRLLTSVIELEKTLQEEVRQEEVRAAAWREREIAALHAEADAVRQELARFHAEQVAEAQRQAAAEAAALQVADTARRERLAALAEPFLEELLRRQLDALLPETCDDHPHGEG